jgi:6-phosphogluconolactonase
MVGERRRDRNIAMRGRPNIIVTNDGIPFTREAAETIIGLVEEAVHARGRCFLALSGGETPRSVYQLLASDAYRERIAWGSVQVFFADERTVPPDDPQSNFGMVQRELLSRVPIPPMNIHRCAGESDPATAAAAYEQTLRKAFGTDEPSFDLVCLGIGEDGHTASLFPGTDVLSERTALVRAVEVPRLKTWRLTFTFPLLNRARSIVVLISGVRKREVFGRLTRNSGDAGPIDLLDTSNREVILLADRSASGAG